MGWWIIGLLGLLGLVLKAFMDSLKEVSIILLGHRGSGKTTLLKFLHEGVVYEKYRETPDVYKVSGHFMNLKDLDLKIKSITDVPGGDYAAAATESNIGYKTLEEENFDYIFYLFNAERVYYNDEKIIQNTREETKIIAKCIQKWRQPKIGIVFIGTHEDKLYNDLNTEKRNDYTKEIMKNDVFKFFFNELNKQNIPYKFLIGSLIKQGNRIDEFTKRILEACYELKVNK